MINNKLSEAKSLWDLDDYDRDLTMFTITNLTLSREENRNVVNMALKLKRKVSTELLTTYFPTILLLLITFTTTFFDKDLFGDAIAVNLTIMLVMTTIFTSKIEELPPTSDMKMIDIRLICCLVIPFLEVILRTTIECLDCSCHICEGKRAKKCKTHGEEKEVIRVLVGTGAKVAPQQVTLKMEEARLIILTIQQELTKEQETGSSRASVQEKEEVLDSMERCSKENWRQFFEATGDFLILIISYKI